MHAGVGRLFEERKKPAEPADYKEPLMQLQLFIQMLSGAAEEGDAFQGKSPQLFLLSRFKTHFNAQ